MKCCVVYSKQQGFFLFIHFNIIGLKNIVRYIGFRYIEVPLYQPMSITVSQIEYFEGKKQTNKITVYCNMYKVVKVMTVNGVHHIGL